MAVWESLCMGISRLTVCVVLGDICVQVVVTTTQHGRFSVLFLSSKCYYTGNIRYLVYGIGSYFIWRFYLCITIFLG